MGKKFKNKASNTIMDNKKKKKQKGRHENNLKSVDKSSKLKFKQNAHAKKQNLPKKIKQRHRNKKKQLTTDLLSPNVAKIIKTKNDNMQDKKPQLKIEIDKKLQKFNKSKESKKNKRNVRNQNFDQYGKKDKTQNFEQTSENSELPVIKQIKNVKSSVVTQENPDRSQKAIKNVKLNVKRLQEMLAVKQKQVKREKGSTKPESLRDRMMAKLRASRFRYLNETLYNNQSFESKKYFKEDPDAFTAYHDGYKQQIEQWPLNPLDVIISSIKKMPKEHIVADFGCGEARLASSIPHKVHSFDFVALNENVTACDMAHTPLLTNGVNVAVFCLSLMGTNLGDYIKEANRVLKKDGILKIAEVESRFEKVEDFIQVLGEYGFTNTWKDLSHNLFYFLDFKKVEDITIKKNKLPPITLKSCLYKKR